MDKIDLKNLKSGNDKFVDIVNPNNKENFAKYLSEISKQRPLSREEEIETFKEIKLTGSKKAIDKICKHNMLFVVAVARRYFKVLPPSTSLTFEDLVSEGNMGLCLAVQRFDYNTGNKFISYAVWWIRQQILKTIQDNVKSIRVPSNATKIIRDYKTIEAYLEQKLARTPTNVEIIAELFKDDDKITTETERNISEVVKMGKYELSLNEIISTTNKSMNEKVELGDMIESGEPTVYDNCIEKERHQLLYNMIERLPPHIQNYFNDYYGLDGRIPLTLKEMADKYEEDSNIIKNRLDKYLVKLKHVNRRKKDFFFPTPDYNELRMLKGRDKDAIYLI